MVEFVGWAFVILGFLFLVVGLIEAIRKLLGIGDGTTGVIGDVILALIKAGLFNVAIGVLLVAIGLRILGYDVFPAPTK